MPCSVIGILHQLIMIYVVIMLVYAVVSWIPSIRGRWTDYVAMLVEPVLIPVRRVIPPLGGLDLSFLVVIVLLQVIDSALVRTVCS
ncbi:MAG TPA: YggT family protein [Candidatus Baltobacteraceae bacterium]|jgi:YggT family protein|nr:YggT family protein [Candidatus Baltobacteraceae bacterium]